MLIPPLPADEPQRLAALRALDLLDTPQDERYDRLTGLARYAFDVPIALLSLVDADRQWFKSRQGLDSCETPRSVSFCGHAVLADKMFIVEDAQAGPRFADTPLVLGPSHVRFHAGRPQVPREAQLVAMAVGAAFGQPEAEIRKALLHRGDQPVDLAMAPGLHHRVDVAAVLRPQRLQQLAAVAAECARSTRNLS